LSRTSCACVIETPGTPLWRLLSLPVSVAMVAN
jgi:hypothetical protein